VTAAVEPCHLAHYLAACSAAKVSPATLASTFRSAAEARELIARVAQLSIPDAMPVLNARVAHLSIVCRTFRAESHLTHVNGWSGICGTSNWRNVRGRLMRGRAWFVAEVAS
jgi:hypothetical protein